MRHLNDTSEWALDRISTLERELRNLHAEHAATRELVIKLPGAIMSTFTTALGAFERALLDRLAQSEGCPKPGSMKSSSWPAGWRPG